MPGTPASRMVVPMDSGRCNASTSSVARLVYIATNDNMSTKTATSGTAMSARASRRAWAAKPDTTRVDGSPARSSCMTSASSATLTASPAALSQNSHCQPHA
ncbi:Uncharacterised protein [Mycobacteroides abscessus subsp. abscessus]|nr:Uncharacterised protein [Mycobacteroides abscessus subsp. abscessus]